MSSDQNPASRRIMNAIGEESRIPVFNIEEGDLYVLVGFPIAGLLIGGFTGLDMLVFPLVLIGFTIGVATVYATPSHLPASTWLADLYRYYLTRPRVTHSIPAAEQETTLDEDAQNSTEGGVISYTPFTPDERTEELTNVRRAWPGAGAIERSDGAMVAMLELNPANMDFAMSGDWAQLQEVGEVFANTELDFPLTIHTTTRPFPVEILLDRIDDRLVDEDVVNAPIFRELLTEYRETRPAEMAGTQQLHHYLGVEVTPFEVYQHPDERSPIERLTAIPLLGVLFTPFVTRRENLTNAELYGKLLDALETRCRTVETELVSKATGWSAHRLSTAELFVLTMEFWNGESHEYDDPDAAIRERAAVDHQQREDRYE